MTFFFFFNTSLENTRKRRRSKQNCKAPFGLASTLFTAIGGFCGLSLALGIRSLRLLEFFFVCLMRN